MPSLYAHNRFGAAVLPKVPADVRGAIARHRALFDAGLQGPDFFFFYKPASKSKTTGLGRVFHYQTGREFFTRACETLRSDSSEEELVYLYGLLAHYCLDAACHPLIHHHTDSGNPGHNAVESEFDRFLMARDGIRNPSSFRRSKLLKLPKEHCSVISRFYPGAEETEVYEALNSMRHFTDLMTYNNGLHRAAALVVLRKLGDGKTGLLIPNVPDPACSHLNEPLMKNFTDAIALYPALLEQIRDYLTFREPLGPEFDPIFG